MTCISQHIKWIVKAKITPFALDANVGTITCIFLFARTFQWCFIIKYIYKNKGLIAAILDFTIQFNSIHLFIRTILCNCIACM